MCASFTLKAPAKINLNLYVTGRRNDGYHLLSSLVAFADLSDTILIKPAKSDQLSVSGPFSHKLKDVGAISLEDNILGQCLFTFRQHYAQDLPPLHIHLEKNIPVGAGIGGGSSDCAALLRGLFAQLHVKVSEQEQLDFALQFGADVPVCLKSEPCIMEAIGEELQALHDIISHPAILINPNNSLSTPSVFKAYKALNKAFSKDCNINSPRMIGQNDLTKAATSLCPEIGSILNYSEQIPNLKGFGMSGSGATCFILFHDEKTRNDYLTLIKQSFPSYWLKATDIGSAPQEAFYEHQI